MSGTPIAYGLLVALAITLLAAAIADFHGRRIDDRLIAAIALGAPLFWWTAGLPLAPGIALRLAVAALVVSLLVVLVALRQGGGGDGRLIAALALWLPGTALARLMVMIALLGGVLALAILGLPAARRRAQVGGIPFGLAIASAGLWTLATQPIFPG